MAEPLSATRLVRALRDEGCRVVEVRDWRDHNRNHRGPWGPINGVMIHHTVSRGTAATVDLCYDGYSSLPGPLCHGVIGKDGVVYLVGNGRANHAGLGDDNVLSAVIREDLPLPATNERNTDGNTRFYGFECENLGDGDDPWPHVQVEAIVRASAAILREYGWGAPSVIGHSEWSYTKIDPRGPLAAGGSMTMEFVRGRVAQRLAHGSDWNNEEADVAISREDVEKIWMTDGIIAAPTDGDNKFWMPSSFIRNNYRVLQRMSAKLDANNAAIVALAQALADHDERIDADALVARIRAEIESIDIRFDTTPTPEG